MPDSPYVLRFSPLAKMEHFGALYWGAIGELGDGRVVLAAGSREQPLRLWDPATSKLLAAPLRGILPVLWGVFGELDDGQVVLATPGSDEGTVRLWDAATGEALGQPLIGHHGPVRWGEFAELDDGRVVLATGGDDGTVRLWDAATGQALGQPLTGHNGSVLWGKFAQLDDGRVVLATGGDEGTVRLWDAATGAALGEPRSGYKGPVRWGAFGQLRDGQLVLATGGDETTVRLWDPATGEALREPLTGHNGPVRWGKFAKLGGDRVVLATGGGGMDDGAVWLWDPETGEALGESLIGHRGGVLWGEFAEIGGRVVLATGGNVVDQTVRLWDPETGEALGDPLSVHQGVVRWGAFATLPDNRPMLVTAGDDGALRVWEVVYERTVSRWQPGYRSDTIADDDELRRGVEATALAELITSRSVRPPMAIGLFGDWGTGKSYFIDLIRGEVAAAAQRGGNAHQNVRQVGFNAWHYAENDMWASLVSEIFRQLANPTPDDSTARAGSLDREEAQREQSRLAADLRDQRGTIEQLTAIRNRRDKLHVALRATPRTPWKDLPPKQQYGLKQAIAGYGVRLDDAEKLYAAATGQATWLRLQVFRLKELFRVLRVRGVLMAVLMLMLLAGLAVGVAALAPLLIQWAGRLITVVGGGGLIVTALLCRDRARKVRNQVDAAADLARRVAEAQQRQVQSALDAADAEVNALEREVQDFTAAGQLAGLVSDRAAEAYYRRSLGLMTHIREDFEHMATLLASAAEAPEQPGDPEPGKAASSSADDQLPERPALQEDKAGDKLPRIDRIVLYIDDLDRCPPGRVVAMLEAVHLLLAVKKGLFVVVLAVDPRWLLRAVGAHYRDVLDQPAAAAPVAVTGQVEDVTLGTATPAQYLEKIFQVVFTMPPLNKDGYRTLLDATIGVPADTEPAPMTSHQPSAGDTVNDPAVPTPRLPGRMNHLTTGYRPARLPAARKIDKIDLLALSPDEQKLMRLLGPPLITTPRSVKRLANSYGLLTALRRLDADRTNPRPAMVLLAAVVGFPALGPQLLTRLRRTALANPSCTWSQFLALAPPPLGSDARHEPNHARTSAEMTRDDGPMKPVAGLGPSSGPDRAGVSLSGGASSMPAQWQEMTDALAKITKEASQKKLELPEDLQAWDAVLVQVSRLSFPASALINWLASSQENLIEEYVDEVIPASP